MSALTGSELRSARWVALALSLAVASLLLLVAPGPVLISGSPGVSSGNSHALPSLPPGPSRTHALPSWGALPDAIPGLPLPALHVPTPLAAGNSPRADLNLPRGGSNPAASDPANPYLDNYSSTTSVAAVGPSPNDVVVGASDATDLANNEPYFFTHGLDAAYRTSDGGSTWTTTFLSQNQSWANSASPSYGDLDFGEPTLAGGNGTALYGAIYAQPCILLNTANCNSSAGLLAPGGIAVARSTNSGVTWGAPVPVATVPWFVFVTITCNGSTASGDLFDNETDKPSVAYSASSNVAVAGWDILEYSLILFCVGTQAFYAYTGLSELAEVSVSHNGGVTWSAPRVLGQLASGLPTVSIGAPPTDTISYAYSDFLNGTASTFSVAYSSSSDNGTNWSAPVDIGGRTLVSPVNSSAIDFPSAISSPTIASDNYSSSPFAGSVYVVWNENRSAGGGVASVALVHSANGGGSWSSTSYPAAGSADVQYTEPSVTVGPNGVVWITEYAQNRTSHAYQYYGEYSTDGGNTWTLPFPISDTPGTPGVNTLSLGTWTGAAATTAGLFSSWTDCRWSGCGNSGITAVYAAHTEATQVSASTGGVQVTVLSSGANLSGPAPFATAWDLGGLVRVSASSWVTETNTSQYVAEFRNFTGIVNSTVNPVAFDYSGGSTVAANYQQAPAGWITGTVSPASANPSVTVGGVLAALSPYNATSLSFNVTEQAGGIFTVLASAASYRTATQVVPSSAFTAAVIHLNLARADGWIRGRVSPATATVTVNNTPVTGIAPTSGLFNVSLPWGTYWLNASGTGLTSFSQLVAVTLGASTVVNIALLGSWISGTVSPGNATVTVDGTAVTVSMGAFNVSVLGGSHTVTASLTDYAGYHTVVQLTPGSGEVLAITLTDLGWIRGSVSPVTATVSVAGSDVPVIGGVFNISVRGDSSYNVTVSAVGYHSTYAMVTVVPANGSWVNFTLAALPPKCTTSCGTTGPGGANSNGSSAAAFSVLDVLVAGVVILGLAAIGALLILRRRSGPPPGTEAGGVVEAAPAAAAAPAGEESSDDLIYGEDRSAPEPWQEGNDPSQGLQPPPR